jgi:LemA protein
LAAPRVKTDGDLVTLALQAKEKCGSGCRSRAGSSPAVSLMQGWLEKWEVKDMILMFGLVLIGAVLLLLLVVVGSYNGLVQIRNAVKNAWAQIDVQLKRRHDLIPNLVETAKGYMQHERGTFEAVTKARNLASQARESGNVGDAAAAERDLSSALSRFFVVVESYPDLKANQNFLALQEELTSTENKISFARQFYNDSVMRFNNKTEMFPSNIIAGMFNFKAAEMFELKDTAEREVPQVKFT